MGIKFHLLSIYSTQCNVKSNQRFFNKYWIWKWLGHLEGMTQEAIVWGDNSLILGNKEVLHWKERKQIFGDFHGNSEWVRFGRSKTPVNIQKLPETLANFSNDRQETLDILTTQPPSHIWLHRPIHRSLLHWCHKLSWPWPEFTFSMFKLNSMVTDSLSNLNVNSDWGKLRSWVNSNQG